MTLAHRIEPRRIEGLQQEKKPHALEYSRCKTVSKYTPQICEMTDFQLGRVLGEGTFATVYAAKDRFTGRDVAIKTLKARSNSTSEWTGHARAYSAAIEAIRLEAKYISMLSPHPNIVQLMGSVDNECQAIILEKGLTDLFGALQKTPLISLSFVRDWARDILTAVDYIHEMRIIHQDIKSTNILIYSDRTAKLCDFGQARDVSNNMVVEREMSTLWYRAPEVLMGASTYCPKIDEWAVGCVLLEMLIGVPPFMGEPGSECTCKDLTHSNFNSDQLEKIFSWLGTPTDQAFLAKMACRCHFVKWPFHRRKLDQQIFECRRARNKANHENNAIRSEECQVTHAVSQWSTIISSLLQYDPNKRLSCKAILSLEPFFESGNKLPSNGRLSPLQSSHGRTSPLQSSPISGKLSPLQSSPRRLACAIGAFFKGPQSPTKAETTVSNGLSPINRPRRITLKPIRSTDFVCVQP